MASLNGATTYKKKEGTLTYSLASQLLTWIPTTPGASPTLSLPVSAITNLQQTPATAAKVALKVFEQPPGAAAQTSHVFSFTSQATARAEADVIKDALSTGINAAKASTSTPTADAGGSSAAMAIVGALNQGGNERNKWDDDNQLKSNIELQISLLEANASLKSTFQEAVKAKPDSISEIQFTKQFWASRIPLLRAHAIEKSQTRGAYNVLATIKPQMVDNRASLSISKEQFDLMFNQHPLLRRVYDENVPRLSETAFWSRFFQSRLFKKLKGDRIMDSDATDQILDKYLNMEDDVDRSKRLDSIHVPLIIDLEGNEENHSQKQGNAPDIMMRPTAVNKIPIIRTLNSMSEKMLSNVVPQDADPSKPIGVDEETFNQLQLRDLEPEPEVNRIILDLKEQSKFFGDKVPDEGFSIALQQLHQNPHALLLEINQDLATGISQSHNGELNLDAAIAIDPDSDSDSDSNSNSSPTHTHHTSSKRSLTAAKTHIMHTILQSPAPTATISTSNTLPLTTTTTTLPAQICTSLSTTHKTTTEFLHHFWNTFLSGSADRASEIPGLIESLNNSLARIAAVAEDAERLREEAIAAKKRYFQQRMRDTGRRIRQDHIERELESVGGGKEVVMRVMEPTVRAIARALERYQEALAAEMKEGGGGGGAGIGAEVVVG
ncbi:MAG: RNA polymerase II transcription factor B subunit 1 [Cirrosporium novae-zelandiae]|nr:MAG: RNA polymerase II transcription factor B subunit 1 [Cirrosporium novae-zelandiae]